MRTLRDTHEPIDIMIVSEGTYPYVRGGVSSWIHQLITGLKEYRFGIVFIGSTKEEYDKIQYPLPENLVYLSEAFMFDRPEQAAITPTKGAKRALEDTREIHRWFTSKKRGFPPQLYSLDFYLREVDERFFLYSEASWHFITEHYRNNAPELPFVDYFWTVRSIHAPIWRLARIAKALTGRAAILHTPSTGYAGFLGALLSRNDRIPLILTEHGIYTKERKIDLLSSDLFSQKRFELMRQTYENDYIKEMWIRFFEGIGYFCYDQADPILSLYHGAREAQIGYGADPKRCRVVPNGVDTKKLSKAYEARPETPPQVVTLIGRVVAIKDIKTFIRAIRIAVFELPDLEGWIVGPMDEDPEYADECVKIVQNLGLENRVKFLGFQNVVEILPRTGILTLTSISEGMPLVLLEGFAAGVPAVATDVGSCRELIEGGLNEEDKQIGPAGEVVQIANASALAEAYIRLFTSNELWSTYQRNALRRVNRFYTQERFFETYRDIYAKALAWQA